MCISIWEKWHMYFLEPSNLQTEDISSFVFFDFFYQCFIVFSTKVLCMFYRFTSKDLGFLSFFFWAIVNGIIFLIYVSTCSLLETEIHFIFVFWSYIQWSCWIHLIVLERLFLGYIFWDFLSRKSYCLQIGAVLHLLIYKLIYWLSHHVTLPHIRDFKKSI